MTDRERLELAAKACGYTLLESAPGLYIIAEAGKEPEEWNPLTDQADSDRIACDLEIVVSFLGNGHVQAVKRGLDYFASVPHNNTIEGRRAAVREARMLVAVEIGRGK